MEQQVKRAVQMSTREQLRMEEKSRELGRKIVEDKVDCSLCGANGFDQFGECEKCEGRRFTKEWVFEECGHEVESEDCINEGCLICVTTECENRKEPNEDRCKECLDTAAYWKAQYDREHHYTREEIMDVYHDDPHKREVVLHEMGLEGEL
jgi:hypothetical protein